MNEYSREDYIQYIDDNVKDLTYNHRKEVLQMIIYSDVDEEKIVEKNEGTEIKYESINEQLLKNI